MAAISQTTFSSAFSLMKMFEFRSIFHSSVLKGPINNNPAFVQVMAWCQTVDKPLPEQMMTQFTGAYMRH